MGFLSNFGSKGIRMDIGATQISHREYQIMNPAPPVEPPVEDFSYPDVDYTEPTSTYPVEFSAFAFSTEVVAEADTPEISEWTRQGVAGDTIVVSAEGTPTSFDFYDGQGGDPVEGTIVNSVEDRQFSVTIPDTVGTGMLMMWGKNANGLGKPVTLNGTDSWWIGEDSVDVGDTFSIYGQNLSGHLYNATTDTWITADSSNPYKADFTVPSGWSGAQTLYIHNGEGKERGWSKFFSLTVEAQQAFNGAVVNVQSYGANGIDDGADDLTAIENAIAATPSGGVLYFPAGTYAVSERVYIGSNRLIRGDGMNSTIITTTTGFEDGNTTTQIMFTPNPGGAYFEDLTLRLANHYGEHSSCLSLTNCTRARINRVRFDYRDLDLGGNPNITLQNDGVTAQGASDTRFEDCEFIFYRPLNCNESDGVSIINCTFRGVYDTNVMVYASNSTRLRMTGCTMISDDDSDRTYCGGWGKGRWVSGNEPMHMYLGNNTNIKGTPRDPLEFSTDLNPLTLTNLGPSDYVTEHTHTLFELTFPAGSLLHEYKAPDGGKLNITASTGGHSLRSYRINDYDSATETLTIDVEDWAVDVQFPQNPNFTCDLRDNVDQNSGEHFMFEGCVSLYQADVASATADTVTLENNEGSTTFYGKVSIVAGRGQGQTRDVVGRSGLILTVNEPWNVIPDNTSYVIGGRFGYNVVMYDNDMSGDVRTIAEDNDDKTATAGFSSYGGFAGAIVDGNTLSNLRSGIMQWGLTGTDSGTPMWMPNYFGLYKNNNIGPIRNAMVSTSKVFSGTPANNPRIMSGAVWRDNVVTGATVSAFTSGILHSEQSGVNVLHDNTLGTTGDGIDLDVESGAYVLKDNVLTGDGADTGIIYSSTTVRDGNTITNFGVDETPAT